MHTSRDHCMGCDPIGRLAPAGPKYSILKLRLLAFETALSSSSVGSGYSPFRLFGVSAGGADAFSVSQPLSRFDQLPKSQKSNKRHPMSGFQNVPP